MFQWSIGMPRPFPFAPAPTGSGPPPPVTARWIGRPARTLPPDRPPPPAVDPPRPPAGRCGLSPAQRRAALGMLLQQEAELDELEAKLGELRSLLETELARRASGGDPCVGPARPGADEQNAAPPPAEE